MAAMPFNVYNLALTAGEQRIDAGVAIIGTTSSSKDGVDTVGILCVAAATASAIGIALHKGVVDRMSAAAVTWPACTIGVLACLPFAQQLVTEATVAPADALMWLVYQGVFPTAAALTTYALALKHMDASILGLTTDSVPVITVLLGIVFLSEAPTPMTYLGGLLARVGVVVAQLEQHAKRPVRWLPTATGPTAEQDAVGRGRP